MTDLIRKSDTLAKIHWLSSADWTVAERRAAGEIADAIAALPAVDPVVIYQVDPAAIREAALREVADLADTTFHGSGTDAARIIRNAILALIQKGAADDRA